MAIIKNQEPVVHTEYSIQKLIYRQYYSGFKLMVPNMYYPTHRFGEMDMFFLRPSGYAEEFEIKVSTTDFKSDVKKTAKHQVLLHAFSNGICHSYILPNRFSYVVSEAVNLDSVIVPEYAGLYIARNRRIDCIKCPPFIHKNKLNWTEKAAKSVIFRYLRQYFRN